jgi:hypothetical protein
MPLIISVFPCMVLFFNVFIVIRVFVLVNYYVLNLNYLIHNYMINAIIILEHIITEWFVICYIITNHHLRNCF